VGTLYIHCVSKKFTTRCLTITFANVDRFSKILSPIDSQENSSCTPQRFPPHLQYVATLTCESWKSTSEPSDWAEVHNIGKQIIPSIYNALTEKWRMDAAVTFLDTFTASRCQNGFILSFFSSKIIQYIIINWHDKHNKIGHIFSCYTMYRTNDSNISVLNWQTNLV